LVGVNDGKLPHEKSCNLEEEKRLCYVGITRAEKELYISGLSRNGEFIKMLFE
jgi:DNA helicase-2/ATP-dependent DNA helicase PcrA